MLKGWRCLGVWGETLMEEAASEGKGADGGCWSLQ